MVIVRVLCILQSLSGLILSPTKMYSMLALFFHDSTHTWSNNGNDALAELGYFAKSRGRMCDLHYEYVSINCKLNNEQLYLEYELLILQPVK